MARNPLDDPRVNPQNLAPSPTLKKLMGKSVAPPVKRLPGTHPKTGTTRPSIGTVRATTRDTSMPGVAETVDENKPLTEKQLIFVRSWAAGESIKTASARAGYNDNATFAYRMTKMPNVLKVFRDEKRKYEEAGQMTRKRVMEGLLEAIEMGKLVSEPATMVSGWREIGKMCGYYEPVKHTVDINVVGEVTVRQLNGMSDADLLKIIAAAGPSSPLTHERIGHEEVEDEG